MFLAGGLGRVSLGVPSGRTFLRLCAAVPGALSQSAVFGLVRDVVTNDPVVGAAIRISWVGLVVDQRLGVRRVVDARADTTDKEGRYVGCGLPTGSPVTVTATAPRICRPTSARNVAGSTVASRCRNWAPATSCR